MYAKTKDPEKIPLSILDEFLILKIGAREIDRSTNIKTIFLWTRDNVDRYRINVWMEDYCEETNLFKNKIGYSFFVHYDKDTLILLDKTVN